MKARNIIINIIPLLVWIIYFKMVSVPEKIYFLMPIEDLIFGLVIPVIYGIYNSLNKNLREMLLTNTLFFFAYSAGCYISGRIYLNSGFRGSDYPYAVNSITCEVIVVSTVIIVFFGIIRLILNKFKTK